MNGTGSKTGGLALALAVALAASGTVPVGAQPPGDAAKTDARKDGPGPPQRGRSGRPDSPAVAQYVAEGVGEFTLDRSAPRPLIQFTGSREVLALTATSGPFGDLSFKNDVGQTVLRITRFGGVTVYTENRPEGVAASLSGPGAPLAIQTVQDLSVLRRRLRQQADRIESQFERATGRGIAVDVDVDGRAGNLVVEALSLTSQAIDRAMSNPAQRARLASIKRIKVEDGPSPNAVIEGETLRLTISVDWGRVGWPSSERISLAIR